MRAACAKLLLIGLVVAGGASTAAAQGFGLGLFSERGVDFGPVPRGAKVRHNFVLTNRLPEAVTILNVTASCGCTTGRASATTVPPGGTAVIEAEMDTRNFVGMKATTLTVALMTASGRQDEVKFGVQSNILADIVLNPGSADFGVVAKGQTPQQVISIERLGNPRWGFTRMIASPEFCRVVHADLKESYRSADGVGYNLVITLRPDAPAGVIRDEIRLVTNDPESPSVPVLVTAQVQGSLTATPALLALGNVAGDAVAQGRFVIRADQPFTITGLAGDGDGFTLAAADATPKPLHVVTVSFDPSKSPLRGDLRRDFQVTTSLPGEAPVNLSATLRAQP